MGKRIQIGTVLILFMVCAGGLVAQSDDSKQAMAVVGLDNLSDTQSEDLYQSVLQQAYFELGYDAVPGRTPSGVDNLTEYELLETSPSDNEDRTLLIGLKTYATKGSEIVFRGHVTKDGEKRDTNPDLPSLKNFLIDARKQMKNQEKSYPIRELEVQFYQLTNILPEQCLKILQSLGYNTSTPSPGKKLALQDLPVVYKSPMNKQPSIVADKQTTLKNPTQSAPQNRLIFLYHSSQRDDIVRLKKQLRQNIDVPSRQVLIESMVVELTREGRRELGVQWEGANNKFDAEGGFQTNVSGDTPLSLSHDVFRSTVGMDQFRADLRALVKDQEAEVLSSPSVLTLNNTQASIEVVEEVPVFNTVFGSNVPNVAEFNVSFEEVGITLNIKPRISKDSDTVTMQIQGEVSEAPRADFVEIDGDPVAPLINRRRVQTIARVNNNTPFIIGGLIRQRTSSEVDRVPVLSEIPLIHPLFKVQKNVTERLEDIIVLNPRVISPDGSKRPIKPKDSDRFDFLDNKLFRNTYRLKSDDVFDLGFIEQNDEVQRLMRRAKDFVEKNPEYRGEPPFDTVVKDQIPGEEAVGVRMLYEIALKLDLVQQIKLGNLIFFEKDESSPSGFDVEFLQAKLSEAGIVDEEGTFIKRSYPRKVLVLRYSLRPQGDIQQITNTPVAEAEVKQVQNREEVNQLLLEQNKIDGFKRPGTAFVVDSKDDLQRLKAAIMVREMISVNDVDLRMDAFRVGRKIMIPEVQEQKNRIMLIDQDVSRYFYESEFYYTAMKNKLRAYNEGIRDVLGDK